MPAPRARHLRRDECSTVNAYPPRMPRAGRNCTVRRPEQTKCVSFAERRVGLSVYSGTSATTRPTVDLGRVVSNLACCQGCGS